MLSTSSTSNHQSPNLSVSPNTYDNILQSHTCHVQGCDNTTTASPIPNSFLSLASLCFPQATQAHILSRSSDSDAPPPSITRFDGKTPSYLCSAHRAVLQQYRAAAVAHAERISRWNDDEHYNHINQSATESQPLVQKVGYHSSQSHHIDMTTAYVHTPASYQSLDETDSIKHLNASDVSVAGFKRHWIIPLTVKFGWTVTVITSILVVSWAVVCFIKVE